MLKKISELILKYWLLIIVLQFDVIRIGISITNSWSYCINGVVSIISHVSSIVKSESLKNEKKNQSSQHKIILIQSLLKIWEKNIFFSFKIFNMKKRWKHNFKTKLSLKRCYIKTVIFISLTSATNLAFYQYAQSKSS